MRRNQFLFPVVLTSIAVLSGGFAASALADTAPLAAPYTLINKYVVGDVHKYAMTMDMTELISGVGQNQPMNIHLDMTTTNTIQSVQASDGAAVEKVKIAILDGTVNGQPMPITAMQTQVPTEMTETITPTGRVTSMASAAGQPPIAGIQSATSMSGVTLFPGKPVNIGDSWNGTIPMPALSVIMKTITTLKSVQVVGNSNIALLDTTMSAVNVPLPEAQTQSAQTPASTSKINSMKGDTQTSFDLGAGIVTHINSKSTMDMTTAVTVPGQGQGPGTSISMGIHMNMVMDMILLPAAGN